MKCPCCGQEAPESPLTVALDLNLALFQGKKVKLTPQEAEIVHVLTSQYPKTVSRNMILGCIYGAGDEPEDAVGVLRVHMVRIRRKLQPFGVRIDSIFGRGYRLGYV